MNKKNIKKWIYLPLGMTIGIYGTVRLVNDFATDILFWERPWQTTVSELLAGLAMVYVLFIGIDFFTRKFNQKSFNNTKKQIAYEVRTIAVFSLLVINTMGLSIMAFTDNGIQPHDPVILNVVSLFFVLIIFVYRRANYYIKAYSDHRIKAEELAREKIETELKFLKAQINPHFLFNAINNIYHLINEDKEKARDTLDEFSQMLRYQLYECNGDRVPLKKELEYLRNYIAVQNIRYSQQLKVEVDFPDNEMEAKIAPCLFLPLVENAYKFVGGDRQISLRLDQNQGWINFKSINSIDHSGLNGNYGKNNGIGLENLNRRLKLLYPGKHEIHIEKGEDRFEVNLKVYEDQMRHNR